MKHRCKCGGKMSIAHESIFDSEEHPVCYYCKRRLMPTRIERVRAKQEAKMWKEEKKNDISEKGA